MIYGSVVFSVTLFSPLSGLPSRAVPHATGCFTLERSCPQTDGIALRTAAT